LAVHRFALLTLHRLQRVLANADPAFSIALGLDHQAEEQF
jgi:hypothetical protein